MNTSNNHEFLDQVIAFWQPFCPEKLSQEDARQMIEAVGAVFDRLNDWSEKERGKNA